MQVLLGRRRIASLLVVPLLALLASALALPSRADTAPPAELPLPFAPGEELRFTVKFGPVRAGEARLSVHGPETVDGQVAYRFRSTAESSRFFSTFFPVKDRVESVWSVDLRLPLRFEKHIREGKYAKDAGMRFDHGQKRATYTNGKSFPFPEGSQDVLSAFYFVRSQPLAPGMLLVVPNHTDGKNYPVQVRVLRRETVTVPAGTFACVVVEPLLKSAGLFKQEGNLTIWLTDDARRMPVLMKSKVAVGSIAAEFVTFGTGGVGFRGASPGPRRPEAKDAR
jgi:hypothetical protein